MRDVTLDHRYAATEGQVLVTGLQALARIPLDQARLDQARGWNTAGFVSGYRGSPLAGYDQELSHAKSFLTDAHIVVRPAVNEELAATAVWGTQQVGLLPGAKYEGVFGLWYGKSPGVDRSIDALRHANFAGVSPKGGVLLLAGDDPECKSSTLPSQSEYSLIHSEIPVLCPSDIQDVLDFGVIGLAMSRYSGCWIGMICTTDLMDSYGVVEVGTDRYAHLPVREEKPGAESPYIRAQDTPQTQEIRLRDVRVPAALEFSRLVKLNRVTVSGPNKRLGIIAAGRAYAELMQALQELGLDASSAANLGISVFKMGLIWPFDHPAVREFALGHEDILVIEDKRDLIETQVKEALFNLHSERRPRVLGKRDANGQPLLPDVGVVTAADIARAIVGCLPANVISFADAKTKLKAERAGADEIREPFYCSGCPHNRSTKVLDGSTALAGIGCHYMARWIQPGTMLFTQMGGEGAQWAGMAPFTDTPHVFANLGDGTYFHSGLLAIRQSVAAQVNITYKILFNGAVAMTGGQHVDGPLDVPSIARQLTAEGLAQVAVVADDISRYAGVALAPGVKAFPREDLKTVERQFRDVKGTTAIIYDQMCATERRRQRKRGMMPDPAKRAFINELVCEGCGDCSAKSNCISVEPVETEFGRKRRINQSSCNKDYSCVEGFCPSFVTLTGAEPRRSKSDVFAGDIAALAAPPEPKLNGAHNTMISGIGGLGVTTLAAILSVAAYLEGRAVRTLNRTGLAQKGGAVASHIRIASDNALLPTPAVPAGEADLHLAYDMIVAASAGALVKNDPARTATLINHHINPTSAFVRDTAKVYDVAGLEGKLAKASRDTFIVDARGLAETLLGNELFANMIMLGYALQKGWLPLSLESVNRAITLNGASAKQNRQALDIGRLAAVSPEKISAFMAGVHQTLTAAPALTLTDIVAQRRDYLRAYRNDTYAAKYETLVQKAHAAEQARAPGADTFAKAVAKGAFAAMMIKDEYEVARLLTDPAFAAQMRANFTGDFKVSYNLAPAFLAKTDPATGEPRKIVFGAWLTPVLRLVAGLKGLRETAFDPLKFDPLRRTERNFRDDYLARIERLLGSLNSSNVTLAAEIAALPLEAKGYGHVKEKALAKIKTKLAELTARFERGETTPTAEPARKAG